MALVNTWIVTLRGRRGTYGTGLALVARLVPRPRWDATAFCVAGVALCDIHLHFVWQASHLMTWIIALRGRRGTWRHRPPLCVAGVALMALDWLWWHTKLFHTTLSQIHFTHNFVTDSFHTQLCHTSLSHTTLSHTTLSHTTLSHNSFTHNSFTHNFVTYISFTHKLLHTTLLQHKLTHTQHCHTQLFHPTCLAPSPFLPAFPIAFSHLIGDHWKKLICGVIRSFSFFSCKIIADADATGTVRASRSVILCTTAFFDFKQRGTSR